MARVPLNRYLVYILLASSGLALDWGTKDWIFGRLGMPGEQPPIPIAGDYLVLQTSLNEGALFGMGQGFSIVFAGMSMLAVTTIIVWLFWAGNAREWVPTIALGSISGGVLGNFVDRLGLPGLVWHYPPGRVGEPVHAVRDWIHFQIPGVFDWPVFNVADMLLVGGAILLVLHALLTNPVAAEAPGRSVSSVA